MNGSIIFDSGRDNFLARPSSKPPSKFDSIEFLEPDVHDGSTIAFKALSSRSSTRKAAKIAVGHRTTAAAQTAMSGSISSSDANASTATVGKWSGPVGSNLSSAGTEAIHATSWKAKVSRRPSTTVHDCQRARSPIKTPGGMPKKFLWGPRAMRPRQEITRDVRRTNHGEPATFSLAVEECPSTVSTLRSVVRRNCSTTPTTKARAFTGMELYIRTAITDRVHDGIYNTDKGHKATIASRVKGGKIHSPSFSRHRKRPVGDHGEGITSHERAEPGYYNTSPGIDATSETSTFLPLPQEKCEYDCYIREGLGQTTGSAIGPGKYEWQPMTSATHGASSFSHLDRWDERSFAADDTSSCTKGPWDDVDDAWSRGGYIESAIPRDCKSCLPPEVFSYVTSIDVDHFGKQSLATAMRRSPRRYAASFSKTQEPDWRVIGHPALGPGTYAVERAERLAFPSPVGGAGDADPSRPSVQFLARRTPFDTRRLGDGYKSLKPRFSTPRAAIFASELSGPSRVARRPAGVHHRGANSITTAVAEKAADGVPHAAPGNRRGQHQAGSAVAIPAAAADPYGIGGPYSRFVRLERPSASDPKNDRSRRRAAAVAWRRLQRRR